MFLFETTGRVAIAELWKQGYRLTSGLSDVNRQASSLPIQVVRAYLMERMVPLLPTTLALTFLNTK